MKRIVAPLQQTTEASQPLPRLAYNLHETAEILGISYISVWRLLKRGKLRSSNAFRTKLIPVGEIQRFLNATLDVERPPRKRRPQAEGGAV